MHWETKKFVWLVFCDNCFTAVVWGMLVKQKNILLSWAERLNYCLGVKCYPKWSTDSMESLPEFQWPLFFFFLFCRNGKVNPQIHTELWGTLNKQNKLPPPKKKVGGSLFSKFKT